jgi:CubicO group peptidase (beta-lactamase class C family)
MTNTRWLSTNRVTTPKRLRPVTRIAGEADPVAAGLSETARDRIWRDLKLLYRSGMFPGIGFCLRRRGEIVLDRSIGYARGVYPHQQDDEPEILTPDTPICLFSASKAVTAMLVHHLVEIGEIHLHDRVTRFFPEYGQQGKDRTTIAQLLSHRAGIPRIREDVDPQDLFDPDKVMELLCRAKPQGLGRNQAYHAITAGFILGEVVERVTGEPLNQVLDRVIRKPMGMTHFSFGLDSTVAAENVVTGLKMSPPLNSYLKHAVGSTLEEVVSLSNDPRFQDVVIPAGNLYATAEETSRFFQMLLNDGEWQGRQIFKPETVHKAIRPVARRPRVDRTLLFPLQYSHGFMLGHRALSIYGPGTPKAFGHLGFITIIAWADPQRDISGALLTTGKTVIGTHLPALLKLQIDINRLCSD